MLRSELHSVSDLDEISTGFIINKQLWIGEIKKDITTIWETKKRSYRAWLYFTLPYLSIWPFDSCHSFSRLWGFLTVKHLLILSESISLQKFMTFIIVSRYKRSLSICFFCTNYLNFLHNYGAPQLTKKKTH